MDKEISEIAKLTERISLDPKSKLFVPLAEEYNKVGDTEMAVHVLLEGLKNNPGYVTARSFLGKLLLETGDLAAAQKEFEQVVQAVPDNLMAQRKLGDVYVLLGKPDEALKHYSIALSLNPKDEKFAALVQDIQSGQDISARLHPSRIKQAESSAEKEPPAAVTARQKAAIITPPLAKNRVESLPSHQDDESLHGSGKAGAPAEGPLIAQADLQESEEPEEVLVVEPLEAEPEEPVLVSPEPVMEELTTQPLMQAQPVDEVPAPAEASAAEHAGALEQTFSKAVEEPVEIEPLLQSKPIAFPPEEIPASTDAIADEVAQVQTTVTNEEDAAEAVEEMSVEEAVAEVAAFTDLTEAELAEVAVDVTDETTEEIPEITAKTAPESTDDFTTDTLAELYIAQGFYEKAVDIYERMLVEKPGSRGLREKLAWVKAAAARTEAPQEESTPAASVFTAPEPHEPITSKQEEERHPEPSLFAESREYQQPALAQQDQDSGPAGEVEAREYIAPKETEDVNFEAPVLAVGLEDFPEDAGQRKVKAEDAVAEKAFAEEHRPHRPAHVDFEPREYVPPKPKKAAAVTLPIAAQAPNPHLSSAKRNETIGRLETWLSQIRKEK